MQILKKFARDKTAATAIEYALLASSIALVIVGAVVMLGNRLSETFNETASNLH